MRVVTIGAYGFTDLTFRTALASANVNVFVDVRRRRGVRGPDFAFANSKRVQAIVSELGLTYLHVPEVAPTLEMMKIETNADHTAHIRRRDRDSLVPEFVLAYQRTILDAFETDRFMEQLPPDVTSFALFCVERVPEACHRSLLAERLATDLNATVEHIVPS